MEWVQYSQKLPPRGFILLRRTRPEYSPSGAQINAALACPVNAPAENVRRISLQSWADNTKKKTIKQRNLVFSTRYSVLWLSTQRSSTPWGILALRRGNSHNNRQDARRCFTRQMRLTLVTSGCWNETMWARACLRPRLLQPALRLASTAPFALSSVHYAFWLFCWFSW